MSDPLHNVDVTLAFLRARAGNICQLAQMQDPDDALARTIYHEAQAAAGAIDAWRSSRVLMPAAPAPPHGCVCPPGAESTCQGMSCPRRGYQMR